MLLCSFALIASTPKRTSNPAPGPFNFELVMDSATILADDYAEAMANKPEMVKSRMNALKRFYAPYSANKTVADSICNVIFNMYVDNIERDNIDRANAFKECFTEIADKDNEHYGPLYATELFLAQETSDTARIKELLPLLSDYAERNGHDYADEINSAESFIKDYESRRPINEEIIGVWVGESICHDKSYTPSFMEAWVSDIDGNNEVKDRLSRKSHVLIITGSEAVPIYPNNVDYSEFPLVNYKVPQQKECLDNFRKKKSFYFDIASRPSWLYKESYYAAHPQVKQYDENSRSAYFLWANDELNGFNPDYYAMLRQQMQESHASNLGELARKGVSISTKAKVQLASGAMYSIGNAVLDHLAVSTARAWVREMMVFYENPNALRVWVHFQFNIVKSNSPRVSQHESQNTILYIKWTPEDEVFFLSQNGAHITLGEETKSQKKANKELVKRKKEEYQAKNGKIGSSRKKYDVFRQWFNTQMFNKLKENKL